MSATSKLGSLLRRLRIEKNLTQADVAEVSGLARVHIANLETGKRGGGRIGWETMIGFAKAFGVSPDEFSKLLEAEQPVEAKASPQRGRPRKQPPDAASQTPAAAAPKKPRKPNRSGPGN